QLRIVEDLPPLFIGERCGGLRPSRNRSVGVNVRKRKIRALVLRSDSTTRQYKQAQEPPASFQHINHLRWARAGGERAQRLSRRDERCVVQGQKRLERGIFQSRRLP